MTAEWYRNLKNGDNVQIPKMTLLYLTELFLQILPDSFDISDSQIDFLHFDLSLWLIERLVAPYKLSSRICFCFNMAKNVYANQTQLHI